jgi:hypothetical protein
MSQLLRLHSGYFSFHVPYRYLFGLATMTPVADPGFSTPGATPLLFPNVHINSKEFTLYRNYGTKGFCSQLNSQSALQTEVPIIAQKIYSLVAVSMAQNLYEHPSSTKLQ